MATEEELPHGIPIFLDQLIATLTIEETSDPPLLTAQWAFHEVRSLPASSRRRVCMGATCSIRASRLNKLFGITAMSAKPSQI